MSAKLVTFVYTDGRHPEGRTVQVGPGTVQSLIERGAPIRVLEGEEYLEGYEPPADPEGPEQGEAGDGWPDGYSWESDGAYYAVRDPDGEPVESDAPSGKWHGENAAQEAAWDHEAGEAEDGEADEGDTGDEPDPDQADPDDTSDSEEEPEQEPEEGETSADDGGD